MVGGQHNMRKVENHCWIFLVQSHAIYFKYSLVFIFHYIYPVCAYVWKSEDSLERWFSPTMCVLGVVKLKLVGLAASKLYLLSHVSSYTYI